MFSRVLISTLFIVEYAAVGHLTCIVHRQLLFRLDKTFLHQLEVLLQVFLAHVVLGKLEMEYAQTIMNAALSMDCKYFLFSIFYCTVFSYCSASRLECAFKFKNCLCQFNFKAVAHR